MRGFVAVALATALSVSMSASAAPKKTHEQVAREVAEALGKGDFPAAVAHLGPDLAKALPADKLGAGWAKAVEAAGAYRGLVHVTALDGDLAVATLQFEKGLIDVAVKVDGESAVALHTANLDPWLPPAYADAAKSECSDVTVGSGDLALPGSLCMPKGAGPFPLVMLVHGSGPGDRDETIGHMKLFWDLALGLSARGIAVLRWEKRTHGHMSGLPMKAVDSTIKEEYLDDVRMAATYARTLPRVDKKRIYVAGHSQGGWLVPWFLENDPALAGGILLAGPARQFVSGLPQQLRYIAEARGDSEAMTKLNLAIVDQQVKRALDPKLPLDTPLGDLPLGIPAKYWLSLQPYDAPAVAVKLDRPMFILQGERDYQVTVADDIAIWKKTLGGKKNVTIKTYPKLNHAFVAGEGKILPQEYLGGGHTEVVVVDDIAAWVKQH